MGRLGRGRRTIGEIREGSETLREVRDKSGDPRKGPGGVG